MNSQTQFGSRFGFYDIAKDSISGFKGKVTAFSFFVTGCNQVLITPECKNGEYKEPMWFDEERLILVKKNNKKVDRENSKGGPQHIPSKR